MPKLSFAAALVVSALALLLPARAFANTINVGPGQTCTTIQCGVNLANSGDTIRVAPGTYVENVDFLGKMLMLESASGAKVTIIDGNGAGPALTVQGQTTNGSYIEGFTLTDAGKPQTTGGPYGAVYIANTSVSVDANTVTKAFCAGIVLINSNSFVDDNTITGTQSTGCPPAEGLGSGLVINGTDTVPFFGGTGSSPVIELNTITANTASVLYSADKGGGGAINITNVASIELDRNTLSNNVSTGYGGAVYVANTPSLFFINNLVFGNKGISGGLDIVVPGSSVGPLAGLLANNTIVDNTATTSTGGSDIYIGGNLAQYALVNNIIVGDVAGEIALDCGTTYANQTITPLILDHNDIFSAVGTAIGGACTSAPAQDGNISADPQFIAGTPANVTAGTQNFHILTNMSPVIDSGNNSVFIHPYDYDNLDLDNNARVADATSLPYAIVDMGAYEFTGGAITPTTLQLTPSTYTPATGSSLTLTALLNNQSTAIPAGTITFTEDFAPVGTAMVSSTGAATLTLNNLTAGLHTFLATYPGQGFYSPATSIALLLNVSAVAGLPTVTTLTSSANPSNFGQAVTLTATITASSGTPTGQVEFTDGGTSLGLVPVDSTGHAALTISTLATGSHSITAGYIPTGVFNGGTASLTQIVLGANSIATLTVAPASAPYGSPITATATVAPANPPGVAPTGTVNFTVDGALSGAATLNNGVAAVSYSTLPGGPHTFGCAYLGDTTYAPSTCNSATATVVAGATTLTLASSKNPSPSLTPITFTATLTSNAAPVAGATITFTGAPGTATTNAAGVATLTASLPAGTYTIAASFAGNASAAPSAAQLTQIVTANPTTTTLAAAPNPGYQNQTITLTASVTDTAGTSSPLGTVTFYDGTTLIGTASTPAVTPANPTTTAVFTTTSLAPGTHTLTATYTPDTNSFGSTSASVSEVILASTFTFTPDSPTITIETQHHASMGLHVTSIGGFTGPIALSCGSVLPPVLTCELASQLSLPANATASTTLTLDTDAVLDFKSSTTPRPHPGSHPGYIALAALLPLALLTLTRRRKPLIRGLLLFPILYALSSTLFLATGCSGKYPASTPPGTYDIYLTATGTTPGSATPTTQTIDLKLTVTP